MIAAQKLCDFSISYGADGNNMIMVIRVADLSRSKQPVFWPLEILECDEGKKVHDEHGNLLAYGLSVRMGVHCGMPVCEQDHIETGPDMEYSEFQPTQAIEVIRQMPMKTL
jgi:hypothetical protein